METPAFDKIVDIAAQRYRMAQAMHSYADDAPRGEQPDEAIHSLPGALRGETPLSRTSESEEEK